MNAYTLEGLLTSAVVSDGRDVTTAAAALQMFYSELWLITVRDQFTDRWKKLRQLGWDDVFAAAWAQADGSWPQDSSDIEDLYGLVFGDHYHVVAQFTDGRVGTNTPPTPK